MAEILVGILTTIPLIFKYIDVRSPNLNLNQGISYLEREGGERETERKLDRQIQRK
jgi:hypothetical protein